MEKQQRTPKCPPRAITVKLSGGEGTDGFECRNRSRRNRCLQASRVVTKLELNYTKISFEKIPLSNPDVATGCNYITRCHNTTPFSRYLSYLSLKLEGGAWLGTFSFFTPSLSDTLDSHNSLPLPRQRV